MLRFGLYSRVIDRSGVATRALHGSSRWGWVGNDDDFVIARKSSGRSWPVSEPPHSHVRGTVQHLLDDLQATVAHVQGKNIVLDIIGGDETTDYCVFLACICVSTMFRK